MPHIRFTASHFPAGWPKGRIDLDVSWAELAWAAITVGKWRTDITPHRRYPFFEAASRVTLLWAYLHSDGRGRLERTHAYNDLDSTEKSGVSYALGMCTAKVFAARQLSTPLLMHVDRYRHDFGIALRPGRSRPDLVGPQDPDALKNWIVVEAKGRTHNLDSDAIASMLRQKRRVVTVMGQKPVLFVGSAAHFSSGELEVEVVDPPARGRRTVELFGERYSDEKRRFVHAYYGPLIDLLEESSERQGTMVMRELPFTDLRVGLPAQRLIDLREYVEGQREDIELGTDRSVDVTGTDGASSFVGADEVRVELGSSWSDEAMELQPNKRP